ncbi:MAG: hypothetical protein JXQ93_10355 [Flavobacteriaceae bacterium]
MNKYLKLYALLLLISIFAYSCKGRSEIALDFNCNGSQLSDLESVDDFEKNFSIPIPKNWKVNLYYDNAQSSIYFADTTKQLTETMILDITYIKQKTNFDDAFLKNIQANYKATALQEEISKEFVLNTYPSYYTLAKGLRNNFTYTICNIYVNTNSKNLIHAKLEVYGDSIVNERICKGISLIEKVAFK